MKEYFKPNANSIEAAIESFTKFAKNNRPNIIIMNHSIYRKIKAPMPKPRLYRFYPKCWRLNWLKTKRKSFFTRYFEVKGPKE